MYLSLDVEKGEMDLEIDDSFSSKAFSTSEWNIQLQIGEKTTYESFIKNNDTDEDTRKFENKNQQNFYKKLGSINSNG